MNFTEAIKETYRRIPWELDAEPFGSADHTLGTTVIDHKSVAKVVKTITYGTTTDQGPEKCWVMKRLLSVLIALW